MARPLSIAVLVDPATIPQEDPQFRNPPEIPITEYHVCEALRLLGYHVTVLGAERDIASVARTLTERDPDLVFNLTEQFCGDRRLDKNIAALLELLDLPFTGAGAMGLLLARDKRLCKEILRLHKIRVPTFISLPLHQSLRVPKNLPYPMVVKPAFEDSSEGISNASLVYDTESLRSRAAFIHERWNQPAIAEEYIEGRELYVSILGNKRLTVLPPRECFFNAADSDGPVMLTYRCKWDQEYRNKWQIDFGFAELEPPVLGSIERVCKRAYRALQLQDYGRIDLRLTPDNQLVILEANPNPDIAYGEEVAEAADRAGIDYDSLIARIIHLALKRYD
ncbi:MAG: ATP-grasp domain-containing protein [Sedimentisphaerales bacterium]|nr:ATP-grasp domain-containing protein [Sedimentisphaerales bacterium]